MITAKQAEGQQAPARLAGTLRFERAIRRIAQAFDFRRIDECQFVSDHDVGSGLLLVLLMRSWFAL
jgi:hypothetical protein